MNSCSLTRTRAEFSRCSARRMRSRSIVPLGVSSPVADVMFDAAKQALRDVIRFNDRLMKQLDVERFFYSVRPYYKPYRVGRQEYRGANAGDFSGINEIDLLLGLCRANDPYYAQLLVDKMLFMLPSDQARLRDCMTRTSLLDELLSLIDEHQQRRLVSAERPRLPRGLRLVRTGGGTAPRWSGEAVHRESRGQSQRARPRGNHSQRAAAAGAAALARSAARPEARGRSQRYRHAAR